MLCVVSRDTGRAIESGGSRRLWRDFGRGGSTEEVLAAVSPPWRPTCTTRRSPVPDRRRRGYRLAGAATRRVAGRAAGGPPAPAAGWPLRACWTRAQPRSSRVSEAKATGGVYPESPHTPPRCRPQVGQDRLAGFLVAGVSPRRPFDDGYRGSSTSWVARWPPPPTPAYEEAATGRALAEWTGRSRLSRTSATSWVLRSPSCDLLATAYDTNCRRPDAGRRPQSGCGSRSWSTPPGLPASRPGARASFEPTDGSADGRPASNFRSACSAGLGSRWTTAAAAGVRDRGMGRWSSTSSPTLQIPGRLHQTQLRRPRGRGTGGLGPYRYPCRPGAALFDILPGRGTGPHPGGRVSGRALRELVHSRR